MATFLKKTRSLWIGLIGLVLVGFLIPLPNRDTLRSVEETWPQFEIIEEDDHLRVFAKDIKPWSHVKVLSLYDGYEPIQRRYPVYGDTDPKREDIWLWEWNLPVEVNPREIEFFHSCHEHCQLWGKTEFDTSELSSSTEPTHAVPTKLGVVLSDPQREWYNKQGWSVEVVYADSAEDDFWGVDDLALRVHQLEENGVRILVRVEFSQGQNIPLPNDYAGLEAYLAYVERLARDERLDGVYGFIIGSNMNATWANKLAGEEGESLVTPEWYARVFNGYGADAERGDNVIERVRVINPNVRIFAGPINPWNSDQDGEITNEIDVPWLNYMNSMVAYLDEGATANSTSGIPDSAPDGFAVQAFGRMDAPEVAFDRAAEPHISLPREDWNGAQSGFRVYEDWLAIINRYENTVGKPLVINATNTGGIPIDNYPKGWLTNALDAINDEPQIIALCWFMDTFPHDDRWVNYSLGMGKGFLQDVAVEFEQLLEQK